MRSTSPRSSLESVQAIIARADSLGLRRLFEPVRESLLAMWLFRKGRWKVFLTDSLFPVAEQNRFIEFDPKDPWPLTLFKCLLKFCKGFEGLSGVAEGELLCAVTGLPCFEYRLTDRVKLWVKANEILAKRGLILCLGFNGVRGELSSIVTDGRTEYYRVTAQGRASLIKASHFLAKFHTLQVFYPKKNLRFYEHFFFADTRGCYSYELTASRDEHLQLQAYCELPLMLLLFIREKDKEDYALAAFRRNRKRSTLEFEGQAQKGRSWILVFSLDEELADSVARKVRLRTTEGFRVSDFVTVGSSDVLD